MSIRDCTDISWQEGGGTCHHDGKGLFSKKERHAMNTRKPDVIFDDNIVVDILQPVSVALDEGTDIEHCHVKGVFLEDMDFGGIYFRNVIFEDCRLLGCRFSRCGFVDVLFKDCDLSNCDCSNAYFDRCEVDSSKWMGVDLSKGSMKQLTLKNSNLQYSNWDSSTVHGLSVVDCEMHNAIFSECTLKSIEWRNVQFVNTDFFKTPLKGIDFSRCEIENLLVSDNHTELQGAIVNTFQAADFARLLGLVVR